MKSEFANLVLQHSEKFKAIYRLGNQSKAAVFLGIHQSTLSYALKQLEEAFGSELFLRIGNSLRPTQDAERVMAFLQKVDQVKIAFLQEEDFSQFSLSQKMRVSLAGDGYLACYLLPEISNVLYAELENSGVLIDFSYQFDSKAGADALLYNEIDIFVAADRAGVEKSFGSNIKKQLLLTDQWCFAVSRATARIRGVAASDYQDAALALPRHLLNDLPARFRCLSVYEDVSVVQSSPHRADHVIILPCRIANLDYFQLTPIEPLFEIDKKISVYQYWNVEKTKVKSHAWLRAKIKSVSAAM